MEENLKTPMISVIMSVYNSEKYLCEAIDSILNQTFTNFEFIIINDGSTDDSAKIVQSYSDKRIIFINNKENKGQSYCSNLGLQIAKGKYIARMDSDDISLPQRFEIQYKFMEENPDIDICGTWIQIFGDKQDIIKRPLSNNEIKIDLIKYPTLAHPTVLIKRAKFIDNGFSYNINYRYAEDYKLWIDIAKVFKMQNLPIVLLNYRWHDNNSFTKYLEKYTEIINNIGIEYFKNIFDLEIDNAQSNYLINLIRDTRNFNCDIDFINSIFNLMLHNNKKSLVFTNDFLVSYLSKPWQIILFKQKQQKIQNLKLLCSPFYIKVSFFTTIKFIIKCLLSFLKK